jgi:cell division protein FtsQ
MHQSIGKRNKIVIYFILLITLSTMNGKFNLNNKEYLSANNKITIQGLSNDDNFDISNRLKSLVNKNVLFISSEEIVDIIDDYNIIEEYSVKRIYPKNIVINITPTRYLARTSNDNKLLVGANGKLIRDAENSENLPFLFGDFKSKSFLNLKKDIEKSKFTFDRFKTLYFFKSNRWDILTSNDILIKLPLENSLVALNLAYKIIENDQVNKKIIDLRVKDRLIIN